jgi:transcriptional regulator GlxA family with amidase domain
MIACRETHIKETNAGAYGTRQLAEVNIAFCFKCIRAARSNDKELRAFLVLAHSSGLPIAGICSGFHHYSLNFSDDPALEYRDA